MITTICEYWVGLWKCVARSNPQASTREPSAKQTAECEARLFVPQAAQSSPYRRIQIRNLIRDSSDERNRLRNEISMATTEELLQTILQSLEKVEYIKSEDIPDIDLYMDQVLTFMDRCVRQYARRPRTAS